MPFKKKKKKKKKKTPSPLTKETYLTDNKPSRIRLSENVTSHYVLQTNIRKRKDKREPEKKEGEYSLLKKKEKLTQGKECSV